MSVRFAIFVLALVLLMVPLSGCTTEGPAEVSDPVRAAEIRVALDGDPPTLNPNFHGSAVATIVTRNIFDALFQLTPDGEVFPALAESWDNPEPERWIIDLRRGVKFHDGQELTAHDAIFTLDRILDEELNSPQRNNYSFIEAYEALDDYTVEIRCTGPYPIFLVRMSELMIVPSGHLAEVGEEEFSQNPIGTGPYRLESWDRDQKVILDRFSDHWRGEPEIGRVIWRIIPDDAVQVQELRAGGVDLVPGILPDQVQAIADADDLRVVVTPITRTMMLPIDNSVPPLDDIRVRQALNYAVDREAIVENTLSGMGVISRGIVPPMVFGHNPEVEPYEYDPELAVRLLEEAGIDGDLALTFKATASRIPNSRQITDALRGYWDDVGIETELEFFPEIGPWLNLWPDDTGPIPLASWGGGFDAEFYYRPLVRSGSIYAVFTDPHLDDLIDEAQITADDDRRLALYHQAERHLVGQAGWVFLWSQKAAYGLRDGLDWEPRVDEQILIFDIGGVSDQ